MTETNKNDENQWYRDTSRIQKQKEEHNESLKFDSDKNLTLYSIHMSNAINSTFQTVRLVSLINMFFIGAFIHVYVYDKSDPQISLQEVYTIIFHVLSILLMGFSVFVKTKESNKLTKIYKDKFNQVQYELENTKIGYFGGAGTKVFEGEIENDSTKLYKSSYIFSLMGYIICILFSILSILELMFQEPSTWYLNRLDPGTFLNF